MCKRATDDNKKGNYYSKMVVNIMSNLRKQRMLYRLDVNFKINDK